MHARPGRSVRCALLLIAACAPGGSIAHDPGPSARRADDAGRRRAVMLSLDALSERRVRETLPADAVPALLALFEGGACAEYATPAWPSKTAPSHAALWTGAWGSVNGIAANWQPALPRDSNRITDLVSGYAAGRLRAEPVWITAARSGARVTALHPTQAPEAPGYPGIHGAPEPALVAARAAAGRALDDPGLLVVNGYGSPYAPDLVVTERTAPPAAATAWRNLERLGATLPPREITWRAGADTIFGLLHGSPAYDRVLVATSRDAAAGVVAVAAPLERGGPHGRELARHFSEALPIPSPRGRVYLRVRLFALAPDASEYLLFQPALHAAAANHPAGAAEYMAAIGGWVGNGAQGPLARGELGTRLQDGGDGTAELRYLETLEYHARQFISGSDWAWRRGGRLQVEYFPVADETDHRWYGYVEPSSPAYRPDLAARFQAFRIRAWGLVDRRLAALQRLVGTDPDAALFVGGDHGMRATWREFRANAALREAGLLAVDDSLRPVASRSQVYAPDGLYALVNTTDWLDGTVPPDSARLVLERAERVLRGVRGEDGQPVVTATWLVVGNDSLGRGGPVGGGLYWETAPGYAPSDDARSPVVGADEPGGTHGFPSTSPDMRTVLCGWGPSIEPARLPPARIIDFAPTVMEWLGLPAPPMAQGGALPIR